MHRLGAIRTSPVVRVLIVHTGVLVILLGHGVSLAATDHPFGYFPERPQLEWLDDGRLMQLLRDFLYIDQTSTKWLAPKGAKTDGASIPRILWSFVGGPFEGQYRNAAIVHDTECGAKIHDWRAVHRMFYNASRAGGVGWIKANLMYAAVYAFGPHWKLTETTAALKITPRQAKEYLTRLIVILRRNFITRQVTIESAALDSLERLSYEDVIRQVPDNDPDLAKVRSLLMERERIRTNADIELVVTDALQKVDDTLYYDNVNQPGIR